ncbi:Sip1 protein [Maudiozyma humilis]|uniref:Sip1 protein n=1 Tax=Maudiozyma humilis TaxID=51915 RepID=A0AAV5S6F0_MAUHU|nr:Sip1 protein [Kazachstania humilis]
MSLEPSESNGLRSQTSPSSNASNGSNASPSKHHHHLHPDYKGFFKRHFSSSSHRESQSPQRAPASPASKINEDMANLSIHGSGETDGAASPTRHLGHASPTVQHTDHDLTPRTEHPPLTGGAELHTNDSNNNNNNNNPTISSLKQNLAASPATTPTVSAGSTGSTGSMEIDTAHTTASDTIDRATSPGSFAKKQSHPYQYEYFPLTGGRNSNSIDEDAGVLQNEDKLINQAMLQNVVKRDMKRKRNDSMSSGNKVGAMRLTPAAGQQQQPAKDTPPPAAAQKPMSATAAIMMRLYNNDSQIKNEKSNEVYKRKENGTTNGSFVDFSESLNTKDASPQVSATPGTDLAPENKKLKMKRTTTSESSLSSESVSDMDDDDEEDVEVILKWRDQIPDLAHVKMYLVSKEIVSTLLAMHPNYTIHEIDRQENRLHMIYDPKHNEWFLPGLFVPPGIYRFQFSINGTLTHSNYLPTATNTIGSIVNWFEVLPGYDQIEPYRDYDKINASSANLSAGNSVSNSLNAKTYSTASLTDYAGISRSNSMISNGSSSTLRIANYFNGLLPLTPKKPEYSNEIPELFKFDSDLGSPPPPPANVNAPFDMTLSKVVDSNQDELFANMQRVAKMSAEEAEKFFLTKFKVSELPVYLNSTYLNKNFNKDANHIIPHVNLNHLLTSSIKDDIICVGCTTRYAGKFITQVMYAPCSQGASSD